MKIYFKFNRLKNFSNKISKKEQIKKEILDTITNAEDKHLSELLKPGYYNNKFNDINNILPSDKVLDQIVDDNTTNFYLSKKNSTKWSKLSDLPEKPFYWNSTKYVLKIWAVCLFYLGYHICYEEINGKYFKY